MSSPAVTPPATQSVGCFQSVVNFHNDIASKLKESCSCISRIEINDAGADADGTIMKVIKMFAMVVAIIPIGLWHLLCTLADKITSCCRSTPAQQNTLPPGGNVRGAASRVLGGAAAFVPTAFFNALTEKAALKTAVAARPEVDAKLAFVATLPGMSPVIADQEAVLREVEAWVPTPAFNIHTYLNTQFTGPADVIAAKTAVAACADAAAKLACVAAMPGMSTVVADQEEVLAAIEAFVLPPFVPADFFNAIANKAAAQATVNAAPDDAAKLSVVAGMAGMSTVVADQQAVLAAIQAWVAPPFVPADFFNAIEDKAAAKAAVTAAPDDAARLAVVAEMADMSPVVADQQAVLAAIQAWVAPPFVAADFLATANVDEVVRARIALSQLAAGAAAAARRNAIDDIADLPAAEADVDAIVALVAARPFPAQEFVDMANEEEVNSARIMVAAAANAAAKRAAVENEIENVPVSDADVDTIVAILEAQDYPSEVFLNGTEDEEILTARIALTKLSQNAPPEARRNALRGMANLPVADAAKDLIAGELATLPFSADIFTVAIIPPKKQADIKVVLQGVDLGDAAAVTAAIANAAFDNGAKNIGRIRERLNALSAEEKAAVLAHLKG